ncbi:MAG: hypothetical protein ABFD54_13660 [Armatimonadota bacterium]|nr:hypothetical protein [bacterium]
MKPLIPIKRYPALVLFAAALMLLALIPAAYAQDEPVGILTISITNDGLVPSVQNPVGGLYTVVVRNDSSNPRGIVMRGIDLCCAPYTRLVKLISPGEQVTFRWFFPSNRSVEIRDLVRCEPAARTCSPWVPGGMMTRVNFL